MAEDLVRLAVVQLLRLISTEEHRDRELPSTISRMQHYLAQLGMDVRKYRWIGEFSITSALKELRLFGNVNIVLKSREVADLINNEVEDYIRRVTEFCSVFAIPVGPDHILLMRHQYSYLACQGKLAAAFKQSVNVLFCDHWGVERPVLDSTLPLGELFPAALRQFFARMKKSSKGGLRHTKKKNCLLAWSLLQGLKKSFLPVRPAKMGSQLKSHSEVLSVVKPREFDEDKVERIVETVCQNFRLNDLTPKIKNGGIGTKSTTLSNAASMGNLGYIAPGYNSKDCRVWLNYTLCRSNDFLGYCHRKGEPVEIRGFSVDDADLVNDHRFEVYKRMTEDPEDSEWYETFRFDQSPSQAIPAMILEPMKVRIITKPSTLEYLPLQCLQKDLSRALYSHDSGIFALTGETITDELITGFVARSNWSPGDLWISGDYTAATDNLHPFCPSKFMERIWGNHTIRNPEVWARISESLFNTRVDYSEVQLPREDPWAQAALRSVTLANPNWSKRECWNEVNRAWRESAGLPESISQTSGQLMGNVLSFCLLCLTNLVAFWYSWEEYLGKKIRSVYDLPPLLINGDDILFKAHPKFYEVWKKVVKQFGLEPSIGKNFASDSFLTINSCLYRVNSVPSESGEHMIQGFDFPVTYRMSVTKIPYVNMGLICNRRKNDCSKDYSIRRVSHVLHTDSSLPEVVDRLVAAPTILQTLLQDLPSSIVPNVKSIYFEHARYFRTRFTMLPWKQLLENRPEQYENICEIFRSIVPRNPFGVVSETSLLSIQKLEITSWEESDIITGYYQSMKKYRKMGSWEVISRRERVPKTPLSGTIKSRRSTWIESTDFSLICQQHDLVVASLAQEERC